LLSRTSITSRRQRRRASCYDEALAAYRINAAAARRLDIANAAPLWAEALALYRAEGVEAGIAECTRRLQMLSEPQ